MKIDAARLVPIAWRAFQERAKLGLLADDLNAIYEAAQPMIKEIKKRWPAMDHVARTAAAYIVPEWRDKLLQGAGAWEPDVRWVQTELKARGLYQGVIDGKWGDASAQALMQFQQQVGFTGRDIDGMPGPKTVGALLAHPY